MADQKSLYQQIHQELFDHEELRYLGEWRIPPKGNQDESIRLYVASKEPKSFRQLLPFMKKLLSVYTDMFDRPRKDNQCGVLIFTEQLPTRQRGIIVSVFANEDLARKAFHEDFQTWHAASLKYKLLTDT